LKATWGDQAVASLTRTGCNQPHQVEFAGAFFVPDIPWSTYYKDGLTIDHSGCAKVDAQYLGYPNSTTVPRSGLDYFTITSSQERWQVGDRAVRCYLTPYPRRTYVGSYKGVRAGKPHV
jgi:hypothetical protein